MMMTQNMKLQNKKIIYSLNDNLNVIECTDEKDNKLRLLASKKAIYSDTMIGEKNMN